MGRYYSGDIQGKMWFSVQPSDDADFFGVIGLQTEVLKYEFWEEDKDGVQEGINKCLEELGKYTQLLDDFFNTHSTYNDRKLVEAGLPKEEMDKLLEWYARLQLGRQILACLEEQGSCCFEVEL